MSNKTALTLTFLSIFSLSASAEGFYGSFSLANASTTDLTGVGKSASGLSYALILGYEFNPYFSEEIGYTSLLNGASMSGYAGSTDTTVSADGIEVTALASWPVSEQLSIFGRIGYAVLSSSGSLSWGSFTIKNLNGLVYGPGIRINLSKEFDIRAGYNIYTLNGTSDWTSQNGSTWTSNGDAVINTNYLTGTYHF